ncbi:protein wings apart-like isoform X2 [Ischnura elegans]|uniref:protein wings apart-like isoform X2 n=1 Tax=Ischnura elegans TaxID=197161 RepID=UPI001ED88797|nr:protein wings apart-like isoform X2 [Ischnura elegans]
MSGKYSKVYGKRTTSSGIQFEKLFKENSNRPSAAKSAGTVGRWGITSFTSIRSTNINDALQNKQMTGCPAPIVKPVCKPRKFFKSRNADQYPAPKEETEDLHLRTAAYVAGSRRAESNYGHKTSDKYTGKKFDRGVYGSSKGSRDTRSLGSKKFFVTPGGAATGSDVDTTRTGDSDVSSCVNDGSSHNTVSSAQSSLKEVTYLAAPVIETSPTSSKPPIRLRIFKDKGTSHLVSETQELVSAVVSPPSSYSGNAPSGSVVAGASSSSVNSGSREFSPGHYVSDWTSGVDADQEGNVSSMGDISGYSEMVETEDKDDDSSCEAEESSEVATLPTVSHQYPSSSPTSELPLNWRAEEDKSREASPELPSSCSPTPPTSTFPDEGTIHLGQISDNFIPETTQPDVGEAHCSLETMDPTSSVVPEQSCLGPVSEEWMDMNLRSSGEAEALATDSCIVAPSTDHATSSEDVQVETTEVRTVGAVRLRFSLPKKCSIFKSRRLLSDRPAKRLALYRHKWCDEREDKDGVRGQSRVDGCGDGERDIDPVDGQSTSMPLGAPMSPPPGQVSEFDGLQSTPALTRVTVYNSHGESECGTPGEPVVGVKCTRGAKEYYTVVRNVKKAHQIQESGEFQEFNDDVEYILDALQETNPMATRCLSAISLAAKCMEPAFRMHLRAHGTVAKFFRALHDATSDPSLGLCTATVMFVLSQDRLNMDLDRDSLELMLNLLEVDGGGMGKEGGEGGTGALDHLAGAISSAQLDKNKHKVRELCAEIQGQGHAVHLDLDNITVGHLAMETLLSLTSRRAGEWFKEELRELGGLEHIVKTVTECCCHIDNHRLVDDALFPKWSDPVLDKLRKIIRCLRILENVTHQNEENQTYLLKHGNGTLVDTLIKLYRLCDAEIPLYPVHANTTKESTEMVLLETLISTMKVLINLTHDYNSQSYGSTLAGEREGIMEASLHCLLQVPNFVPEDKKFEILVLALALLINLVEHSPLNRKLLIASQAPCDPERMFSGKPRTAVEALIFLFCEKEAFARVEEAKTDAILDGKKEETSETEKNAKTPEEFIEETVAKLLQKAGRHMEETLIAAYVALLLGYVVMENKEYENFVRQYLPEGNFQAMLVVLEKFFNFMNLTASAVVSSRGIAATERVINYLRKCDSALLDTQSVGDCDSSFV